MLTFLCEDFEEINLEVQQKNNKMSDGVIRNLRGTASFQVKCIHDGQNYSATFLTSEMDKVRQLFIESQYYVRYKNVYI